MSRQVQVTEQKNTRLARVLVWVAVVCNVVGLLLWCPLASESSGAMVLMLLLALVANGAVFAYAISQGLVFELMIERTWKKVCNGLGGNFVGQGRARLQPGLSYDFYGSFKKSKVVRDKVYPKLRNVQGSSDSWTGDVYPIYGQNVDDYNKQADRFALAFHVPYISFEISEHGLIRIRAGHAQVPPMYGFQE